MTTTRTILTRHEFLALCDSVDDMLAEKLIDALHDWQDGDTCSDVDVALDSKGNLDSESSPRPARNGRRAATISTTTTKGRRQ